MRFKDFFTKSVNSTTNQIKLNFKKRKGKEEGLTTDDLLNMKINDDILKKEFE